LKALISFFSLVLVCHGAFANKADQNKPLIINADRVEMSDVQQKYTLTGDVLLIRGSLVGKGERGFVQVDPQGYQMIDLNGKPELPASMRQKREGLNDEFMQGFGKDITYDDKKEQIVLTDNAIVKRLLNMQMLDQLQGWQIEYEDIQESYRVKSQTVDLNRPPQSRAILAPRKKVVSNSKYEK
jgi:lipopolysaccharide export system protein LptA